jgi:ribosomal protein L11 methyltransferase
VEDPHPLLYREAWPEERRPLRVGRTLLIGPPGTRGAASDRVIELDLGASDPSEGALFGTGAHPTTRLALELLEERLRGGERVLDVGAGTGVLALAAVRLGAGAALAVEIDPLCALAARSNVRLNGLEAAIRVREGSVEAADDGPYDAVLANLLAPAIIELAPELARLTRHGGFLILSGVIAARAAAVAAALCEAGLFREAERRAGDWRACLYARQGDSL